MLKKIVVVGSSNTDMIIQLERLPKPGETIVGGEFTTAAGGKGANQAVAAVRAGGEVSFICRIGSDMFGETSVKGFVNDKLDISGIIFDKDKPSGVALIFVDEKGENSIAVAPGSNGQLSPDDIISKKHLIDEAGILLMQLEIPLETVEATANIAVKKNIRIILNPAPARPLSDELLKKISIITPNETEAEILTGVAVHNFDDAEKAAKILVEKGVKVVIITLGSAGAFVYSNSFKGFVQSYRVKAVDTTAAGDVFNGALSVALSENMELEKAVKFANAAAALSVTKLGAQPSAPLRKDIINLITK